MARWLVVALFVSWRLPSARAEPTPTAPEVVKKVQAFYAGVKQATAGFRQEVTNQAFGAQPPSTGTVWIAKPGKMRWDYTSKKGVVTKNFIADGNKLYFVNHLNQEVTISKLAQDTLPAAVTFLLGRGNLAKDFTSAFDASGTYGDPDDLVVDLTPKAPSAQYKHLVLVVDPSDFHVEQTVVIDSGDNVNRFLFVAPDVTTAVAASRFTFDAKQYPTYRIVRP